MPETSGDTTSRNIGFVSMLKSALSECRITAAFFRWLRHGRFLSEKRQTLGAHHRTSESRLTSYEKSGREEYLTFDNFLTNSATASARL